MKTNRLLQTGLLAASALALWTAPAAAQFIVPGSVTNATVDPASEGDTLDKAFDNDYLGSRARLDAAGPGNISFVIDLEAPTAFSGLAFYGRPYYEASMGMLSGTITLEAGASATGPWTVIGSRDVGGTRPTDPDPTIGGENPFTGGNGRLIPATPTTTQFVRVTGGQDFDNTILIYEIQINPRLTLHQIKPAWQLGQTHLPFDPGGGPANSRVGADLTDGLFNTRTFMGAPNMEWVFDLGEAKQLAEWRFHTSDNDEGNMVRTGELWVSSTDDPTNFDTKLMDFNTTRGGQRHGTGVAFIPQPAPSKRYYQVRPLTNNTGAVADGTNPTYRLSEIDYREASESPVRSLTVVDGSLVGGVAEGDQPAPRAVDRDYSTAFGYGQTDPASSFVVDLGGTHTVDSVAVYGLHFYSNAQLMISPIVTVEAASSASGPWTEIGSVDVGSTRPTDPDPAIGGVNPFSGGNGRRIVCTPTEATHIRIGGGYGFDNNVRVCEIQVNPRHVMHKLDRVYHLDDSPRSFDFGGGPRNSRVAPEVVDGDLQTRINPQVTSLNFVIDAGNEPFKMQEIRIFPMDNDLSVLPFTGTVRVSSTDDPENMDTVETTWSSGIVGGAVIIPLPNKPEKRFVELEFSDTTLFRAGEIEIIAVPELGGSSSVSDWSLYAF